MDVEELTQGALQKNKKEIIQIHLFSLNVCSLTTTKEATVNTLEPNTIILRHEIWTHDPNNNMISGVNTNIKQ